MPLSIRNRETVALAREVAALRGKGLTETIHEALQKEKHAATADSDARPDAERRLTGLRAIQDEVASWPRTGLKADKAFFDSLHDE